MRILRSTLLAVSLSALATPVLAGHCPVDVAAIDAALAGDHGLDANALMVVQTLRDRGADLHPSDHGASLAHLHAAMDLLGLEH